MLSAEVRERALGKGVRRHSVGTGTKIAHAEMWTDAEYESKRCTPLTTLRVSWDPDDARRLIFYSLFPQGICYCVTRVFLE